MPGMNRGKTITNNILLFTIGNFGSRILTFLMVLVYTHFIDTSDLGYYDIIITSINLLQPIVMLSLTEGIYRWLIDSDDKPAGFRESVISTCNKTVLITTLVAGSLFFIVNIFFKFQYAVLIAILFLSTVIYLLNLDAVRGLANNKLYAISGLLNCVICLAIEVVGLVVFKAGVEVLLYAKIIANVLTTLLIVLLQKQIRSSIRYPYDKAIARDVLKYSLPLIPNTISWWIVNFSDRYIILAFLGTSFNGIYTVSNKFPTIITVLTGIVYMALHGVIIKEYYADDRDEFFSSLFEKYYTLLFSLIICAIPATKIVIELFVSADYISAWEYTGFLYFSTVFSALASFLGFGYSIAKDTKRSVRSTVLAAAVNIIINVAFIKLIGLHAASISTFVSYVVLFVVRIFHSKKYYNITINWKKFIGILVLAGAIAVGSYFVGMIGNIIITVIGIALLFVLNREIVKRIIKKEPIF